MKKITTKEAKKIDQKYVEKLKEQKTKIDYFFTMTNQDKYDTQLYVKVKYNK